MVRISKRPNPQLLTERGLSMDEITKNPLGKGSSYYYTKLPHEIVEIFRAAMRADGVMYSGEIIADGKLHRFHVEGHKPGTKNGCYVLHTDGIPAGYYQDWKSGTCGRWHLKANRDLTPEEAREIGARIQEAKDQAAKERERDQSKTAEKARRIWLKMTLPAGEQSHPYLELKRIKPYGARLYKDSLVIPVRDPMKGEVVNLQFISPDGTKNFLAGGRKRDCSYLINYTRNSDPVLICEGFATGATLHEQTGHAVVVAFDAGNLINVAKLLRQCKPNIRIIICGDNDLTGVGQAKAREAAISVRGEVLIPPTPGDDWNDTVVREGQL